MTDENTFTIPAYLLHAVQEKLKKLNRRARKLGMAPVVATHSFPRQERCGLDARGAYVLTDENGEAVYNGASMVRVRDVVDVTLHGAAPVIEGYKFVATVDLRGDNPVVRRMPDSDEGIDLSPFFTADPHHCDHCHTRRQRNDVLVLQHKETGELIQIGRNCAADFFRSKEAERMVRVFETIGALGEGDHENDFNNIPRGELYVSLERLLSMASAVVREWGYISPRMAERDELALTTKFRVYENMFPHPNMRPDQKVTPDAEDVAKAREIIDWIEADWLGKPVDERSEFESNVCAVIENGAVRERNFGFLIWMIDGIERHKAKLLEAEERKKAAAASDYVGEVGKREVFTGKLVMRRVFDSMYGPKALCKFVTPEGAVLIWWATGEAGWEVEIDQTYTFKATVKEHSVYNDQKQTTLSRLALVKEQAPCL